MDIPDHLKRPKQQRTGKTIRQWIGSNGRMEDIEENLLAKADIDLPYGDGYYQLNIHPEAKSRQPRTELPEIVYRYRDALDSLAGMAHLKSSQLVQNVTELLSALDGKLNAPEAPSKWQPQDARHLAQSMVSISYTAREFTSRLSPAHVITFQRSRTEQNIRDVLEAIIPDLSARCDIAGVIQDVIRANRQYTP